MTIKELGRVIRGFTLKHPFFGHLVMKLQKEVKYDDKIIDTACVTIDPNTMQMFLMFNSDFWDKLTPIEREGVLHHEIMHIAYDHLTMLEMYPDKKTANIAMDLEINQIVGKANLPKEGCFIDEEPFKEMNMPPSKGTKFYYDALVTEQQNNPELKNHIQGGGAPGNHLWELVEGMNSQQKKLFQNQQDHIMKEAVIETGGPKNMGSMPAGLARRLEKLFEKKAEVFNWKAFFRRFMGTMIDLQRKKTHKRNSKRFGDGSPGLRTKRKQKIYVSVDVSGSVSLKELAEMFEQIDYVYKAGAHIDVVTWDGAIQDRFVYEGTLPEFVNGGGGSNIGLAIADYNKIKKDYTFAIHFTDGFVHNTEPLYGKHLFIITSEGEKFDPGEGSVTMIQIPKVIPPKP